MHLRDLGLRDLTGRMASAHLGKVPDVPGLGPELAALREGRDLPTSEGDIVTARAFEISFRDENHPKSDFVALLTRERIYAGEAFPPSVVEPPEKGAEPAWKQRPDDRWHISISGRSRTATLDECWSIGKRLREGVAFAIVLPPATWKSMVVPNTAHLFELKDERLERMWRGEDLS